MRINVNDKTEKITMGRITELRGNFKEIKNEDGEISYSCDMFRTKGNETFDELYQAEIRKEKIRFMKDTQYISDNLSDLNNDEREEFLNEISDTFKISNREIISTRKQYRRDLNN